MDQPEEYVMYIVVNNDLSMQKGKTASQCCHSACQMSRILERKTPREDGYMKWIKSGETKIVLKATQAQMKALLQLYEVDNRVKRESNEIYCCCTVDQGRTQIAPDSLTTIAFKPMLRGTAPQIIKTLKLL